VSVLHIILRSCQKPWSMKVGGVGVGGVVGVVCASGGVCRPSVR